MALPPAPAAKHVTLRGHVPVGNLGPTQPMPPSPCAPSSDGVLRYFGTAAALSSSLG